MTATELNRAPDANFEGLSVDNWNVVDMVDAGADPTGRDGIRSVWDAEKGDDTILIFPEGTYYIDEGLEANNLTNFKVISPNEDAVFTVDSNTSTSSYGGELRAMNFGRGGEHSVNVEVRGIEINREGTDVNVNGFMCQVEGRHNLFHRVEVIGRHTGDTGDGNGCYIQCYGKDSTLTLEECRFPDGGDAVEASSADDAVGILTSVRKGTKKIINCEVGKFPNNGVYAAHSNAANSFGEDAGPTHVIGGTYYDNNRDQVRVGGNGSSVRNVYAYVDNPNPNGNERGIWLKAGRGQVARDNRVELRAGSGTPIGIRVTGEIETALVENNYIYQDAPAAAIRVQSPTKNAGGVEVKNNYVQMEQDGEWALRAERDGTEFRSNAIFGSGDGYAYGVFGEDILIERARVDMPNATLMQDNGDGARLDFVNPMKINVSDIEALSDPDPNFEDVDPSVADPSTGWFSSGQRPRWNGVIRGGVFGGTDISTISGQFVGDKIMADGTTATNAYSIWRWHGGSWVDGDGNTITP